MLRRLAALALAAFAVFGAACSHYRLGTGVEREFHTLFIAPVDANAVLPQSSALLSTQIREAFIRDGRLRLVNSPDEAEAILTVKLASLRRESLTSLPADAGLTRKYGLALDAVATLREANGEKTWFADRRLRVERQIFTDDGRLPLAAPASLRPSQQTQAEFAIVPSLGEDLAERLKSAVLDTW
jgi:outer membrane lipopolysaccharide assembly protein LptE/RlpB